MDLDCATPPKPLFKANQSVNTSRASNLTKSQLPQATAKTPFQEANLLRRTFKSEFQPRASSRFQHDPQTNIKINLRQFPPPSQRPLASQNNVEANGAKRSMMCMRLGSSLLNQYHQPRPRPAVKEERIEASKSTTKPRLVEKEGKNEEVKAPSCQEYQVKVNGKTYKILRKIGTGGSAKVYEGYEPANQQTVAIKIINVAKADPKTQESYFNEQSILMKLQDSRHVARIYNSEYKTECKELVIVMEKGDADLSQVIDSHFQLRNKIIDGTFIKFYWRGMVTAVNDIHNRGIVHADLKPVNFILVKNEIKLIDFGIADAIDPGGTSIVRDYQIGTINYMAPEALRNRANDASFAHLAEVGGENQVKRTIIRYDRKVDIWSLGCILYNLVYGKPPFDKYQDLISKVQAIVNPRHDIKFPQISNLNLLECMRSCLRYNPAERPSAEYLLNHPYLKEDIIFLARQD